MRLSALLQSVYPPLDVQALQQLLARACREVRGGGSMVRGASCLAAHSVCFPG